MTTTATCAPGGTCPVLEKVTVADGAAFLIASSTVVPSVWRPLAPCQVMVQPPVWIPRLSAACARNQHTRQVATKRQHGELTAAA